MRGEKIVKLPFAVSYSKGGQFHESDEIIVRAPGLGKFQVWSTMKGFVTEAQPGIVSAFSKIVSAQEALGQQESADEDGTTKPDANEDQDVMMLMAMGLGEKRFPAFMTYVKGALTGTPTLASIGGQPLTDEVWQDIDEKGGMDAVTKVLSDFTGFFFGSPTPPKTNGAVSAPTSPSRSPATSPMTRRANSRLPS